MGAFKLKQQENDLPRMGKQKPDCIEYGKQYTPDATIKKLVERNTTYRKTFLVVMNGNLLKIFINGLTKTVTKTIFQLTELMETKDIAQKIVGGLLS